MRVTYEVPDVSQWATWLSPGPASDRLICEMWQYPVFMEW